MDMIKSLRRDNIVYKQYCIGVSVGIPFLEKFHHPFHCSRNHVYKSLTYKRPPPLLFPCSFYCYCRYCCDYCYHHHHHYHHHRLIKYSLKVYQTILGRYTWSGSITNIFHNLVSSSTIEMMERGYPPKLFENDFPSMYHTNKYIDNNNDSEFMRDVFKEQKHYMENNVNEKNWFLGETIRKVRYVFINLKCN